MGLFESFSFSPETLSTSLKIELSSLENSLSNLQKVIIGPIPEPVFDNRIGANGDQYRESIFEQQVVRDAIIKRGTEERNLAGQISNLKSKIILLDAESKLRNSKNITPNTLNQFGEQLQKPESKGILIIAGLVVAALVLK